MIATALDVLRMAAYGLIWPAGGMVLVLLVLWLTPRHGRCKQCGGWHHARD